MNAIVNEASRQRLLDIRSHFRALLKAQGPVRNKAVFYSGTSSSVARFCFWLGMKNPAFLGAQNLEALPAGAYLQSLKPELMAIFGTGDYDKVQSFPLPDGGSFSGSINGMWRELSALYAKACSGTVHVLIAKDRTQLHRDSINYWAQGRPNATLPRTLRVFGFVELPILIGMLSHNSGVTAVNIYVENDQGDFSLVKDGLLLMGPTSGNA